MRQEIDLTKGSIFKNLAKLSAPLMATAFVQMAYILTDVVWVGRIGTKAVAASGTVSMIIWFSNALMLIPRVGLSIRAAQSYGAKDYEKTKLVLRTGTQLAIIMSLLLSLLVLIFNRQIIGFFSLEEEVSSMARVYMSIVAMGFIFSFLNPIISASYNSLGNSLTPFRMNVVGLIANIILDPVMIFGFGIVKGRGVAGAAIATVLSQAMVSILFVLLIIKSKDLIYRANIFARASFNELKEIILLGLPAFFQSGVHSVVGMVLNRFMANYGAVAIAVYSVGSMIEAISWMTTDGLSAAIAATVGQNYGAKLLDRIKETVRIGLKIVVALGLVVMVAFIVFARGLFNIFLPNDQEAVLLGIYYLYIIAPSQAFMTLEIGSTGVYNGIGQPNVPGILGIVFNIVRIPLSLILMPFIGLYGIWIAMSISSALKGVFSYGILRGKLKKLVL